MSAIVTKIASARPVISAPGTRSMAKATRIELMTIAARPSVRTLSGSVRRARVGKTRALRTPMISAAPSAAPKPSSVKRSSSCGADQQHDGIDENHDDRAPQGLDRVRKAVRRGPSIHGDGELSRIPRRGGPRHPRAGAAVGAVVVQKHEPTLRGILRVVATVVASAAALYLDLPAADADRLADRRDVRGGLGGGAGQPPRAAHAPQRGDRGRLPGPRAGPDPDRVDPRAPRRDRRERSRRPTCRATSPTSTTPSRAATRSAA